jgi:hypothetical protein
MTDTTQLLSVYSEETKAVLTKIREELNEDSIFSKMEADYNVYDLLTFNEFNIQDRLERLSFHMKDFRLKFLQEQGKLNAVEDRLAQVVGDKYIALKNGEVALTKTEIERYYLPKDVEVMKLRALVRKQELRTKYFEAVWQAMDKLQWNMKLYCDNGKGGY